MKIIIKIFCFLVLFFPALTAHAGLKAVDGDSLVDGNKRIRLEGIDAPEIFQICEDADKKEYDCGQEAYAYLQKILDSGKTKCQCTKKKDKYGRLLCECFNGDISLNRQMIVSGWAMQYRTDKYVKDEEKAMKDKQGLWQGKFMRPALYRVLERFNKTQEIY